MRIKFKKRFSVSILVASHNNIDTVGNCIDSALNQTYKNIEVVVVDDCSTDGSLDILKSYKDRITLIKLKSNSGAYVARNVALENSSGRFITILDADDIMMSKKIEIDLYNYRNNRKCEIFFSNIYRSQNINYVPDTSDHTLMGLIESERSSFIDPSAGTLWGHDAPWEYKYRLGMQTIFVERSFFQQYGTWRQDFRYGMDVEIVQRYIVKKYNIFVDNKTLFELIYNYKTEDVFGIYLSQTMNYFSYPIDRKNATSICADESRMNIHRVANRDLIKMLRI